MPPDQLDLFGGAPPVLETAHGSFPILSSSSEAPPTLPPPTRRELTKADLLRRGWTRAAIDEHLGPPTRTRGTPWGGKAHLWGAARVLAAEATPAFLTWWQGRSAELAAKEQAKAERAGRLAAEVARWTPSIRRKPLETLRALAIDHYNRRGGGRRRDEDEGPFVQATADSHPAFLDRICVNYVRHALTTYDAKLDRVSRARDGGLEAALLVKARVFDRIAEVYPELAEEARRQKAKRCGSDGADETRRNNLTPT